MNNQLTDSDCQHLSMARRHRRYVRSYLGKKILPYDRTVIAFRSKGQTSLALNERFREIGTTEMIQLSYQPEMYERSERMPLMAYRRRWVLSKVEEYGSNPPIFCLNGMLSPSGETFGGRISTTFDPLLGELLLQMHYACLRHRRSRRLLQSWIVRPKVYLGFHPERRPEFEDIRCCARRLLSDSRYPSQSWGRMVTSYSMRCCAICGVNCGSNPIIIRTTLA